MKARLLLLLFVFGYFQTNAQDYEANLTERRIFEGELHYRTVENHDKFVVETSFGMAYNGARNVTYVIKGNKILLIDECTHICTLIDAEQNKVTLYSNLINRGMVFNYEKYAKTYLAQFSKNGSSFMGYSTPPTLYRFEEAGQVSILNNLLNYIKGRIENKTASTEFEFYSDSQYQLPLLYSKTLTYGIEIPGLIRKMKMIQNNQIGVPLNGLGKRALKKAAKELSKITGSNITISDIKESKTFVLSELKEIIERNIDDIELLVPNSIKIETSENPLNVIDFYKENHAYLVNHGMYPTLLNKEVSYAIDEEWDY